MREWHLVVCCATRISILEKKFESRARARRNVAIICIKRREEEEEEEKKKKMDILPCGNIFRELQQVHDTGYLLSQTSLEDHWEQVSVSRMQITACTLLLN